MKLKKIIGSYSIFLGISILIMWTLILIKGNLPEGKIELGFHLYSEFILAVICIVSGVMLIYSKPLAHETNMAGHAMMVYSVLNAAGYYAQQDNFPVTVMFLVIFVISVLVISSHCLVLKK